MERITFYLILEEINHDKETTGRRLRKSIMWPIVPRVGEQLVIGGNGYPVTVVNHQISNRVNHSLSYVIEVVAGWWEHDFVTLSQEDPSWEKINFEN